MAKHEPGASEAGLATTEQPAASAAAILREGRSAGKFHADERQADADRLVDHGQTLLGGAPGDGLSVDPLGFLAVPLVLVGGGVGLAARFGERLAGLGAHDAGDRLEALADQVGAPSA